MSFGLRLNRALIPQHWIILKIGPQRGHVCVMPVVGMSGLAGGMNGERIGEIAQIHDHAHGGQPVSLVAVLYRPARSVYDGLSTPDRVWASIEQIIDQANPCFS